MRRARRREACRGSPLLLSLGALGRGLTAPFPSGPQAPVTPRLIAKHPVAQRRESGAETSRAFATAMRRFRTQPLTRSSWAGIKGGGSKPLGQGTTHRRLRGRGVCPSASLRGASRGARGQEGREKDFPSPFPPNQSGSPRRSSSTAALRRSLPRAKSRGSRRLGAPARCPCGRAAPAPNSRQTSC